MEKRGSGYGYCFVNIDRQNRNTSTKKGLYYEKEMRKKMIFSFGILNIFISYTMK